MDIKQMLNIPGTLARLLEEIAICTITSHIIFSNSYMITPVINFACAYIFCRHLIKIVDVSIELLTKLQWRTIIKQAEEQKDDSNRN